MLYSVGWQIIISGYNYHSPLIWVFFFLKLLMSAIHIITSWNMRFLFFGRFKFTLYGWVSYFIPSFCFILILIDIPTLTSAHCFLPGIRWRNTSAEPSVNQGVLWFSRGSRHAGTLSNTGPVWPSSSGGHGSRPPPAPSAMGSSSLLSHTCLMVCDSLCY